MIDPTEHRPVATPGDPGAGDGGGNGGGATSAPVPLTWVTGGMALGVTIAVAVALFLIAGSIPGPDTPADASPELIAARVGEYLARWGVALVVVSFVPAVVVAVLAAFTYRTPDTGRAEAAGLGAAWANLIDALPRLLGTAPGIGIAVLLLAVLLLLGNTFNFDGDDTTDGGSAASSPAAETAAPAPTESRGPLTQP